MYLVVQTFFRLIRRLACRRHFLPMCLTNGDGTDGRYRPNLWWLSKTSGAHAWVRCEPKPEMNDVARTDPDKCAIGALIKWDSCHAQLIFVTGTYSMQCPSPRKRHQVLHKAEWLESKKSIPWEYLLWWAWVSSSNVSKCQRAPKRFHIHWI